MQYVVVPNEYDLSWPRFGGGAASGGGYMGKIPISKSNPKVRKEKSRARVCEVNGYSCDELPVVMQSTASDDAASSINRKPLGYLDRSQYVSFDIASYSRRELSELKGRLIADLERIRHLKNQIESGDFGPRATHNAAQKKVASKKSSGRKRSLPSSFVQEEKKFEFQSIGTQNTDLMKSCGQILTKLMKHKNGWVFNTPVDVKLLGLHDYYNVVKHPMDLGTVKSKLAKSWYHSPLGFAEDIRLTFKNAMLYNPKGHDVYAMAEQLLLRFEELFWPINQKMEAEEVQQEISCHKQFQASPPSPGPPREPLREKKEIPMQRVKSPVEIKVPSPQVVQSTVRTPELMLAPPIKPLKQPKPKAKDPDKREMSMEEKYKLGLGLQSLPSEKMEQVVQIIKKRNGHLAQNGDEIELDIETVDIETLWELDRFVTNWKKLVSKIKRQELITNNITGLLGGNEEELPAFENIDAAMEVMRVRKGEAEEEDVDIGDDIPVSNFPAVEIEKDDAPASSSSSSSSSSGSDSSSSSDSDSASSSGNESDADNAP